LPSFRYALFRRHAFDDADFFFDDFSFFFAMIDAMFTPAIAPREFFQVDYCFFYMLLRLPFYFAADSFALLIFCYVLPDDACFISITR